MPLLSHIILCCMLAVSIFFAPPLAIGSENANATLSASFAASNATAFSTAPSTELLEFAPLVPPGVWVSMESGSRPAYVGIHGGTAPVSLMRSANGMLFAFTGQTGNDFMQVLHRKNASATAVLDINATADKTSNAAEAAVAASPDGTTADADGSATTAAVTAANTHAANATAAASPIKDSPQQESVPPAAIPMGGDISKNPALVFASGEMARQLSLSGGEFLPFGLSPSDETEAPAPIKKAVPVTPPRQRFSRIKLGDYKQILQR